jgi:capsular exopolysaccharide synthesis family protein
MSRIHEAIKKAQQERGTSAPAAPEIPLAPEASIPTTPEWRIAPPVGNAASALHPEPVAVLPSGYLRFEDIRANCAHPIWRPDANVNVFVGPGLSANGAEQFRTLRSRLYQIRAVRPLRTLLVTSSVPGEGKTFVTSNLAQSIVRQPDRSVLIIDADLRCARVHTHLGAPSSPGLTDYLRGEADEMAVIQHGQEGNLCLIAGGSEVTNPSELLLNGRFKKLLDNVAPVFDWVIIDSPPCLPVADATILADSCDGVILVVRAGTTPSAVAQRACQEMQGKNVVGVVLNAVEGDSLETYYAQGYGYLEGSAQLKDSQN